MAYGQCAAGTRKLAAGRLKTAEPIGLQSREHIMQYRSADTKMAALREAVRQGRPDIALDMLSDKPTVRAYVRSPASPLGIQIHTRKPFPKGTETVVIVDYGPEGNEKLFYVVPVRAVRRVIDQAKAKAKPRPVNPDSDHCYMAPEKHFSKYLGRWDLAKA
jgi:hypothetical protein